MLFGAVVITRRTSDRAVAKDRADQLSIASRRRHSRQPSTIFETLPLPRGKKLEAGILLRVEAFALVPAPLRSSTVGFHAVPGNEAPPTTLGNRLGGHPSPPSRGLCATGSLLTRPTAAAVMVADPRAGLDLPLRVLVRETDAGTELLYAALENWATTSISQRCSARSTCCREVCRPPG
jgi:hypothetical protein